MRLCWVWARGARREEEGRCGKGREGRREHRRKWPGGSLKKRTGRKGARKGRGRVGGREGKEEGEAGACGERSSVVRLRNEGKAGGCSVLDTLECRLDIIHFRVHSRHLTD